MGGGATLSLAGGIRGRRKVKGGHFLHAKTHQQSQNGDANEKEDSLSEGEGY